MYDSKSKCKKAGEQANMRKSWCKSKREKAKARKRQENKRKRTRDEETI
jgi:hypothetical protein